MNRMANPENLPVPNVMILSIAAVSIPVNEWLYHYTKRIAKKTRSKLLLANAWPQRSGGVIRFRRRDVWILSDEYMTDIKTSIDDFRIHYLN